MNSSNVSFKIQQWIFQKRKLWSKLDTLTIAERFLEIYEWLFKDISLVTTISHILATRIKFDWDLEVEIPLTTGKIPEPPEWLKKLKFSRYQKAIYGKTKYGQSYYDPAIWREYMRKLLFYYIIQCYKYQTGTIEYKAFHEAKFMRSSTAYESSSKIAMMLQAMLSAHFCGFVVCGWSRLSSAYKKTVGNKTYYVTKLTFTLPEGKTIATEINNILSIVFGTICGLTPCGQCRAMRQKPLAAKPVVPRETWSWIMNDIYAQRSRFVMNLTGIKLPKAPTLVETNWTERWARWTMLMRTVEDIVTHILEKYSIDPFSKVKYIDFVRELLFGRAKRHRPSKRGFLIISEQQFIDYLISKYRKMGLNVNILFDILNMIIPIARSVWTQRI